MWSMALMFLIVIIIRFSIRAYHQNNLLKEISKLEHDNKIKFNKKLETENQLTDESSCLVKDADSEDYDENSTGHNVTKILTATGSRKFHLTPEQIEKGNRVNKELMEALNKRKLHAE